MHNLHSTSFYNVKGTVMKTAWVFMFMLGVVYAEDETQKHTLKCDMVHIYEEEPECVDSFEGMLREGIYYGRLRFNSFGFKWHDEEQGTRKNHAIAAVGGSLVYKSAIYNGFSFGGGLYATKAQGSLAASDAALYKAGKGTTSRYKLLTQEESHILSLAEAYLSYEYEKTGMMLGRQAYESFLTKTNDTKMIPNTFEGISILSKSIPATLVKMAYFTRQKLRDHAKFHHVLAYGDNANDPYAAYTQNDDSAMHTGLGLSKLKAKGIEDRLYIFEAKNYAIDNLTLYMNYTAVPELLSSAMVQANYRLEVGDWSILPAVRYMKQFDNGAGAIGGANLQQLTDNYTSSQSLDTSMLAARVDVLKDAFKLRFGYSNVADKGDIVAPWRGFPTGGFTRAMAQYNWYANTESYMVQFDYEFEDIDEFKLISRYAVQDFDDEKVGVQADSKVFTLDLLKGLGGDSVYLKTRYARVIGDKDTITGNGTYKLDPSYDEFRLEINYLF